MVFRLIFSGRHKVGIKATRKQPEIPYLRGFSRTPLIIFKNLLNHMYSLDLGKKVRAVKEMKRQNGEWSGGSPSYGYEIAGDKKNLVIDEIAAATVRMIFKMRLQGIGTVHIANHLNALNVPSPKNHLYNKGLTTKPQFAKKIYWRSAQINRVLSNESYVGRLVMGRKKQQGKTAVDVPREKWSVHENALPVIVDKALFMAVQERIAQDNVQWHQYRRKRNADSGIDREVGKTTSRRVTGMETEENIFVGRIFCASCGKSAQRSSTRMKNYIKYLYFCPFCNANLRRQAKQTQGLLTTNANDVKAAVLSAIQVQLDICAQSEVNVCGNGASDKNRRELLLQYERFKKACEQSEQMLTSAYEHHLSGLLTYEEYAITKAKFDADRQVAIQQLTECETALRDYDNNQRAKRVFLNKAEECQPFGTLTKDIVRFFVKRIEVSPISNVVKVILNYTECFPDYTFNKDEPKSAKKQDNDMSVEVSA